MKVIIRTGGQDLAVPDMPQAPSVGERIRLDIGHADNVYLVSDVRWIIGNDGSLDRVEVTV